MPEDPRTIIINQTQSQTQNGCCTGTGCGTIFAIALLIGLLATAWEGMMGVYGLGWQIALWIFMPILLVVVLAGGFAAIDQHFGWGYTDPPKGAPESNTKQPEDILGFDTANYGTPQAEEVAERAQGSHGDIPSALRQLAELRDQGIITSEEFEAKKRDLLDRM